MARADFRYFDAEHNFDCFDTTRNAASLLLILQEWGLIRHHTVGDPRYRGNFLFGQTPHNTAILIERASRRQWVVDMWPRAYAELHPAGVLLSLDVFGVMAWQRSVDLNHTGQDIVRMANQLGTVAKKLKAAGACNAVRKTRYGGAGSNYTPSASAVARIAVPGSSESGNTCASEPRPFSRRKSIPRSTSSGPSPGRPTIKSTRCACVRS